jgi:hypothetical protein
MWITVCAVLTARIVGFTREASLATLMVQASNSHGNTTGGFECLGRIRKEETI